MMKKWIAAILTLALCAGIAAPAALAEETGNTTPASEAAEDAASTQAPEGNQPGITATETPVITATPAQTQTPAPTPEATAAPTAEPTASPTAEPSPSVTADSGYVGDQRVTMGADLTDAQRAAVYADFGIPMGSVKELKVTNAEERIYLEGLVPERKIGSVALSCIFITTLRPGEGLTVELHNINFCTEDMYRNALTTAGITDARVVVSAPYPVSGTGALTGAYKAYEDITGTSLNELAKLIGAEELVLTGELSEYIGSAEASEIIGQLTGILDQTQSMTDDQVTSEIRAIAEAYRVSLKETQVDQILSLCRKLEGLDQAQLQSKLTGLAKTAEGANKVVETVTRVYENVKSFFESVGQFFVNLFNGSWRK